MSLRISCDAPDCDAIAESGTELYRSWVYGSLQVARQELCCGDVEHGWEWHSEGGVRVDACCIEHLRAGMAVKIAELTDEHAV